MAHFHEFLQSIDLWVWHGCDPGSFLSAVLRNDLREALGCADEESRHELFDIVRFLHNDCPGGCWGSRERVNSWRALDANERIALVASSSYPRGNPVRRKV